MAVLFVDSGAPSIYNKFVRDKVLKTNKRQYFMGTTFENRHADDFGFLESDTYKKYKQKYIEFLLENKNRIDYYANLDVVNNPEETWANQLELESYGLTPIPVFHVGCDEIWLKNLIDREYGFIALGGMIPNSAASLQPILDNIWIKYLTDSKGMPRAKVHGFGLTMVSLVSRYPWFSVDSTSWKKNAAYGRLLLPRRKRSSGEYDFLINPVLIPVTEKIANSRYKSVADRHIRNLQGVDNEYVVDYLSSIGIPVGESEEKDVPEGYKLKTGELFANKQGTRVIYPTVEGISNSSFLRAKANLYFFMGLTKQLPEWPWSVYQTLSTPKRGLLE